jgi:tetratricopeptide (TPR) repeat protein
MKRAIRLLVASAIAVAALFTFQWWVIDAYLCNRHLKEIETQTQLEIAAGSGRVENARRRLATLRVCAGEPYFRTEVLILTALNESFLAKDDAARHAIEEALLYDQRPELYFNLALLDLRRGDVDAAARNARTAVAFNPDLHSKLPPQLQTAAEPPGD